MLRNIPAYAGRTTSPGCKSEIMRKHPRIRGENAAAAQRSRTALETSPHTRGEPVLSGEADELSRNIPAYAGRTSSWVIPSLAIWKHPRIRGENCQSSQKKNTQRETSPHTRGERIPVSAFSVRSRNIPAYAGRTGCPKNPARLRQKHPRIRGENTPQHLAGGRITETSPHTRGEHRRSVFMRARQGNIPAYAGRTCLRQRRLLRSWKHPRIRGENHGYSARIIREAETSPHTRGERSKWRPLQRDTGNIPAYAGRTVAQTCRKEKPEKHPRIRGENTLCIERQSVIQETSPHTRGELRGRHLHSGCGRNIPAYAGRTVAEVLYRQPP